jgi:hypothetical protein
MVFGSQIGRGCCPKINYHRPPFPSTLQSKVDTAKPVYRIPGINDNLAQNIAWHPSENLIAYAVDREGTFNVFGFPGQPAPYETRTENRVENRIENNYPPRNNYMGYGRPNFF